MKRSISSLSLRNVSALFFVALLLALTIIFVGSINKKEASAYFAEDNGIWCRTYAGVGFSGFIPSRLNVPEGVFDYLNVADCEANSPTVTFYGTMASNYISNSTTVPFGTPSIDLAFHGAATVGWQNSSTTVTRYNVVGATAGTSGIIGEYVETNLSGGSNSPGYSSKGAANSFTYSPVGGFTTTGFYDVILTTKVAQAFTSGLFRCVANNTSTTNLTGSNCPNSNVLIRIFVTVGPRPIPGCTDPAALNYDPLATVDDGSCRYNRPPGGSGSPGCSVIPDTTRATVTIGHSVSDSDNDTLTLTLTTPSSGSPSASTITKSVSPSGYSGNFTSFTIQRSSASYSVSYTVSDGVETRTVGPITFTCPLPPPPTISITASNCETITYNLSSGENFPYTVVVRDGGSDTSMTSVGVRRGNNLTIDITSFRDFEANSLSLRVFNESFTSLGDISGSVSVGPCLRMTCTTLSTTPTLVEINTTYSVNLQFTSRRNYGDTSLAQPIGTRGTPINYRAYVNINGTRTEVTSGLQTLPNNNSTSQISHTRSGYVAPSSPDNTSITSDLDSTNNNADAPAGGDGNCSNTFVFTGLPYVQSFGEDIISGYGMRDNVGTCSTNAGNVTGSVTTTLTSSTEFVGSGTQMGVFALGAITGFRSAITHPGLNAVPWILQFANTQTSSTPPGPRAANNALSPAIFGGSFSGSLCAEDWFDDQPSVASANVSAQTDVQSIRGVARYAGPTMRFSYGTPGSLGSPITGNRKIFVDGDIVIGGGNSGRQVYKYDDSGWASIYDIPMAIFVATGNIYIEDNLSELDAVLIARGGVYSCVPASDNVFPNSSSSIASGGYKSSNYIPGGTCYDIPLTLNGAIIASDVRLWRTGGSNSKRFDGSAVVDSTGTQSYTPGLTQAETLWLPPDFFLAPRFGEASLNGTEGRKQLDALISLPPPF